LSSGLRYEILLNVLGGEAFQTRPPQIRITDVDPERAASAIRGRLGIALAEQRTWRRPDVGFRN
jgi:hypothetical protein